MRMSGFILIALFASSCFNSPNSSEQQDDRIERIEKRLDSLSQSNSIGEADPKEHNAKNPVFESGDTQSNRCVAITKKGTRCKRPARSGGHCWQHGG